MLSRCSQWALVVLLLVFSATQSAADSPQVTDLTKRQSRISDKRIPIKTHELKMNEQFGGERIPIKRWHAEFSPIGQRRSPLEVRETQEKTMIRPDVIGMETLDLGMSPQSRRMAFVRNFEKVRENNLVPELRDAPVVTVKEASTPAPSNNPEQISMRDLNRFSFQRNHQDAGGARVEQAASEGEE